MSATNRGTKRRPHDFYPTPIPSIEAFLDVFPLRGGSRCWNREQALDREDAKKVIKNLSEKPFICADDWIEVAGGYLVTTKEHFKKLEKAAAKGKGAKP